MDYCVSEESQSREEYKEELRERANVCRSKIREAIRNDNINEARRLTQELGRINTLLNNCSGYSKQAHVDTSKQAEPKDLSEFEKLIDQLSVKADHCQNEIRIAISDNDSVKAMQMMEDNRTVLDQMYRIYNRFYGAE